MTEDPTTMHSDRPSLDEIVRALREIMPDLALRYGVKHLGVFGSYVRGEADEESDLDILVEFEDPPTLWEFIRLERELGDKLGVKVDLVMKKTLKPGIGEAILKEVVAV
ncbi:MAG TPA: nucleotidyltransferase family protein [Methanothrix sp.]|nr:nucleotidyltransferase family protein [Methanothrix sp.]